MLEAKVKFIEGHVTTKISVINKNKEQVNELLEKHKFPKFGKSNLDDDNNNDENNNDSENYDNEKDKNYDYLIKMPIYTLTKEKI